MSKKLGPIFGVYLLYENGQDFMDIQYLFYIKKADDIKVIIKVKKTPFDREIHKV